jgi:hypothetical protein
MGMRSRRELRIPADQRIELTILGEPERRLQGRVTDASTCGLGIATEAAAQPGAAVKIEAEDSIYLGEVVYCRPAKTGFFMGIELSQVMHDMAAWDNVSSYFRNEAHTVQR